MELELIGGLQTVMSNPCGYHGYFAWPTAARLRDGKLAAAASGFRIDHVCPFGKGVMCISEDEGETWTAPYVVLDTYLDDRDMGLCPFGENGLIINSFNNSVEFQHEFAGKFFETPERRRIRAYRDSYLDLVSAEKENEQIGATFRISQDNGKTFGPILISEINSPHGPIELKNGEILWIGEMFRGKNVSRPEGMSKIQAYTLDTQTGKMAHRGNIPNISADGVDLEMYEPYAVQVDDGTLICHIRVEGKSGQYFTIFQTESEDSGCTWTQPHQILPDYGGAPSYILKHSSGALIATYGFRRLRPTFSVKAIFSFDNGKTWQDEKILYKNVDSGDLGYPSSVELSDGSIITVFYARPKAGQPANIFSQKWKFNR